MISTWVILGIDLTIILCNQNAEGIDVVIGYVYYVFKQRNPSIPDEGLL